MAKKKAAGRPPSARTADYRHSEKRTNIPPAKIAAEGTVPRVPKARYHYSPHLPPVLRFDVTGSADRLPDLIAEAGRRPLKPEEQRLLVDALRHQEPWLEWGTKREQREKGYFEVDPVALHIHERVSAQAIVHAAMREDVQRSLFADPELPYQHAVQFYRHDVDWANRVILGDSVHVMSSLARRENLAGKMQMIYIDPPYGIRFASNFQSEVGRRDVKEKDSDLTREPETVKAYRDTWRLGVHSYLAYLRDRLVVAKELLSHTGSIFVQISDQNVHRVRALLDETFGTENFVTCINVQTMTPLESGYLETVFDYLLWYARNKSTMKYRNIYVRKEFEGSSEFRFIERDGYFEAASEDDFRSLEKKRRIFKRSVLESSGFTRSCTFTFTFEGRPYDPRGGKSWRTNPEGMERLRLASRLFVAGTKLYHKLYHSDFGYTSLLNTWPDTVAGFSEAKLFVVQTHPKIVQRCMLMTTDPGDLVLDPTCGSGTTAYVAEQLGRRWITIDTSRVAVAIARQRIIVARFDHYRTRGGVENGSENPGTGFVNESIAHITLKTVAQNANLDPIFAKHEPILQEKLTVANREVVRISADLRRRLASKLAEKERAEGKRGVTNADRRRWLMPKAGATWEHWEVPFDTDPDWPRELQDAVTAYREAWREKMDDVNACIASNADHEELVDQPEVVKGVVRVSGPFTVEGVRPAELSLGEDGLFGGAPDTVVSKDEEVLSERQNVNAYLTRMVQHLRADGVTFLGNNHRKFARVEPLFETSTGSTVHAEGLWEGQAQSGPDTVAIGFGPQYGPVTAEQVEELVRASRRYDELVIAGFSFDAAASAAIQEASHPKLRIHQAYIRPDINPGMEGLLKDTGQSQLFTVFGQPEIKVQPAEGGQLIVTLEGVDVYDPIQNAVRSTGADKVAAWFLDSDYDGRCFCITQAFFPRQDAWEKIAKALSGSADADAFAAFGGTASLPFRPGKHRRIAVKVIDPRGNEVMAVRALKA
jgi:adenine-specific DNA-methyltransferase